MSSSTVSFEQWLTRRDAAAYARLSERRSGAKYGAVGFAPPGSEAGARCASDESGSTSSSRAIHQRRVSASMTGLRLPQECAHIRGRPARTAELRGQPGNHSVPEASSGIQHVVDELLRSEEHG
jgi:hypothetical protein